MSTQNNNSNHIGQSSGESEVRKAVDHVNPDQLAENLQKDKPVDAPENLTESQETPFIDDDLRTDD